MRSDDFMNAEDVARYLHLGKNTVYQLAKTGQLASYHVGRKLKFTLEDVEAYVASTHRANVQQVLPRAGDAVRAAGDPASEAGADAPVDADARGLSEAASFGELAGDPFVIAGGDISADLIASALNAQGLATARLLHGSYTALVNLYAGDAAAAVVHLYDQKTNSYNVPYARSLAPGTSIVVMRLYGRKQGLIVQKGNPKNLTTWGSLLRDGVKLSNRAKGAGSRVLLDEKLRAMDARSESIEGYNSHASVASAAIRRVASGIADVAIGTRRESQHVEGVSFVALQQEWVDLVVAKRPETRAYIRAISDILVDERFHRDAFTFGPSDLSKMGSIIYES